MRCQYPYNQQVFAVSRIAIIKIHPGLNMAAAQLSGELNRAGHETHMYFFREYQIEEHYVNESYTWENTDSAETIATLDTVNFEDEYYTLLEQLKKFQPDAIGLTLHSLSIPEAVRATIFLKRELGNLPVIWGGAGPTLEPDIAITYADMVCVGEGEEVITEFANKLQNGEDWSGIAGTWAKKPDGEIIKNPKRAIEDLDSIAVPNWNPDDMTYISGDQVITGKGIAMVITGGDYQIMTQRGCPFSCSFCIESRYQEMFGKKKSLRRRSVDIVIDELVKAKETYKPDRIWFWDDVFTVNPRWLKEFLPKYKEKVGIPFWCYTYPTTHSLELLKDLKAAGCNSLTMGIQSGSVRMLEEVYNRPTPLKRVLEAAQEIVDAGIIGYFDLITKSEFETEADLRASFEFLTELPMELVYGGSAEMRSYPTYSYTNKVKDAKATNILTTAHVVDDKTYDFYHNLYWVARNPFIDKQEKLAIADDPLYRENPKLLEQFIYGKRTIHQSIIQMRKVTTKGVHPNILFPPPEFVHPGRQQQSASQ